MKKILITAGIIGSLWFTPQMDVEAATYTTKSGDVLWKIAYDHDTTVSQIMAWNGLNSDLIYPGQILKVSAEDVTATHTVKAGETLYIISQKYNTSLQALIELNPQLSDPDNLSIGQLIYVPNAANSTTYSSQVTGQQIINSGITYLGAGYLYGSPMTRTDVFDCSSFIKRVYEDNGIYLPRVSKDQANAGTTISYAQAKMGDIVSFDLNGDSVIDHVGLYVDSNTILHASTSKGVDYSNTNYYWKEHMVKVTRILP